MEAFHCMRISMLADFSELFDFFYDNNKRESQLQIRKAAAVLFASHKMNYYFLFSYGYRMLLDGMTSPRNVGVNS